MATFRWFKYRTKHAHGPGDWQYREIDVDHRETEPEKLVMAILEEIHDELNSHHDGWRGVEGDFEDPPVPYLERVMKRQLQNALDAQAKAQRALDMIKAQKAAGPVRYHPRFEREEGGGPFRDNIAIVEDNLGKEICRQGGFKYTHEAKQWAAAEIKKLAPEQDMVD